MINRPLTMNLGDVFAAARPRSRRPSSSRGSPCCAAGRCRPTAASCCTARAANGNRRCRSPSGCISRRRATSWMPWPSGRGPEQRGRRARLRRLGGRTARGRDGAQRVAHGAGGRSLLFERRSASARRQAAALLGVNLLHLSSDAGHASAAARRAPARSCSPSITARRRIGVAVGQTATGTASPAGTLPARGAPTGPRVDRCVARVGPDAAARRPPL